MSRLIGAVALAISLANGCVVIPAVPPDSTPSGAATAPATSTPAAMGIPMCDDVPPITAPRERYSRSPIYVANEMPDNQLREWASTKPGFETLWIDRDHLGWVTLAFSRDGDERQAELEGEFPGVGAAVVEVDWTMAELERLQRRVIDALMPEIAFSAGIADNFGVVMIGLGYLRPENVAEVERRFAGQRVCLEGIDPALAPEPGPQPQAGDGWRLLADQKRIGQTYRTGIATDGGSYEHLWRSIGLGMIAEPPPVDFESDVVIWFGAVYGSSCPHFRLDDVIVDHDRALVYMQLTDLNPPGLCTADANPHAYVVALERSRLPRGPLAIQLDADGPPAGAPEERTVVDVDLSVPGATANPGQVGPDPNLPEPFVLESGAIIEPGYPAAYRFTAHCGIAWLGKVNDVWWRTEVPSGSSDYTPPEWQPAVDVGGNIQVTITLYEGPEPTLTATANGHTVVYLPTVMEPPGCD